MLTKRTRLPHGIPDWVEDGSIYFVTVNCRMRGVNQLCRNAVAERIWESFRFRAKRGDWFPHLAVLMPDHLHALISFSRYVPMSALLAKWKEHVAKHAGIRWQRDYFDHRLRHDESYDEKAFYIRMNPVRKGLVARPEDWPYVFEMER